MKTSLIILSFILITACMKSREEYQEAITEVREEQEAEARQRQEEIQREEDLTGNPERSRGSNDAEGMGMDEGLIE